MATKQARDPNKALLIKLTPDIHRGLKEFARKQNISLGRLTYEGLRALAKEYHEIDLVNALEAEIMRSRSPR